MITSPGYWRPLNGLVGVIGMKCPPYQRPLPKFAMEPPPQRIDQDRTFASFHALVTVEPANSSSLSCLNRLDIHDDRRTLRLTRLRSCLFVERCLDAAPD